MTLYNLSDRIITCYDIDDTEFFNLYSYNNNYDCDVICTAADNIKYYISSTKNALYSLSTRYQCSTEITDKTCEKITNDINVAYNSSKLLAIDINSNVYNISQMQLLSNNIDLLTQEINNSITTNNTAFNLSFENNHKYSWLFGAIATLSISCAYFLVTDPTLLVTTLLGTVLSAPSIYLHDQYINDPTAILKTITNNFYENGKSLELLGNQSLYECYDNYA